MAFFYTITQDKYGSVGNWTDEVDWASNSGTNEPD
jgi:hypothetical protein